MIIRPAHVSFDAHRELVANPKIIPLSDDMPLAARVAAVKANRNEPGMVYAHGVRAAYEPAGIHGPAVFGYGSDEASALKSLAAQMRWNLEHHRSLVG